VVFPTPIVPPIKYTVFILYPSLNFCMYK
jgi:hypothetical protein